MTITEFIKTIARINDTNIKEIGVKIGRGNSISFWRTVKNNKIQAQELKKVIESTGEPFVIVYRGKQIHIK